MTETRHWKIDVYDWGTCWATGTAEEAELWLEGKCDWEGSEGQLLEVSEDDLPEGKAWDELEDLLG